MAFQLVLTITYRIIFFTIDYFFNRKQFLIKKIRSKSFTLLYLSYGEQTMKITELKIKKIK